MCSASRGETRRSKDLRPFQFTHSLLSATLWPSTQEGLPFVPSSCYRSALLHDFLNNSFNLSLTPNSECVHFLVLHHGHTHPPAAPQTQLCGHVHGYHHLHVVRSLGWAHTPTLVIFPNVPDHPTSPVTQSHSSHLLRTLSSRPPGSL